MDGINDKDQTGLILFAAVFIFGFFLRQEKNIRIRWCPPT